MDMVEYLNQGKTWINRDGELTEIASMPVIWRRNSARWLVKNAEPIRTAHELTRLRHKLASMDENEAWYAGDLSTGDVIGETTEDLVETLAGISKPDVWIRSTELFKTLMAGVEHLDLVPSLAR